MNITVAMIGTGNVGGNLGKCLSQGGVQVIFGVRDKNSAPALLDGAAEDATALDPVSAARAADVVFLAVPGTAALDVVRSLGNLDGKIIVDCTNPLRWDGGPVWNPPPEGSMAAAIAAIVPGAKVVKAFNTFGAEFHTDPTHAGAPPAQVWIAGDDAEAKETVAEIGMAGGFRTVDAGPLRNAAVLENVAILWIHLATVGGHGRDFTFAMQRSV